MNFKKTAKGLGFLIPTLLTISTALASFDVNLHSGSKGSEVTKLQKFLVQKGLLDTATFGTFGSLTVKAVKAYQKNNNLPATGYVGPMTRQIMNSENLSSGSRSSVPSFTDITSTTTGSGGNLNLQNNLQNANDNQTLPQIQKSNQILQDNFSVDNSDVKVGDIITLELRVDGTINRPIFTAGATINFDPKVLTLIDSTLDNHWIALSQDLYWITDNSSGNIVRTAGFTGGLKNTQTFMTYKFKAIAKGNTKISLIKGMSLDIDSNDGGMESKNVLVSIK